jgi:hypothetical protein
MSVFHIIDCDGDVWVSDNPEDGYRIEGGRPGRSVDYVARVYGIRDETLTLRPLPDATADGYDWPTPTESTVLDQAQAAVYGDREADYGHPREDFTRQAILWTGLLQHKLADGEYIEAEDIARCMVAVKLARDVHAPKRDSRVDGAGYFACLDRLETGK